MKTLRSLRSLPKPAVCLALLLAVGAAFAAPATGPLRVLPSNPRFFTDGSGKAVYLVGSHSWNNLVDIIQQTDPPNPTFDFDRYLSFLTEHNHNCFRLWTWEDAVSYDPSGKVVYTHDPLPYTRTGPGTAVDGKPRFDLTKFNQAYFDRLRHRVMSARDRGIYCIVMLFAGWHAANVAPDGSWKGHPYHPANNINGLDDAPEDTARGPSPHSLRHPRTVAHQEAYVRKVLETVNDLDNVLFEITNEDPGSASDTQWQYHIINFIKRTEKTLPKQHPVGMTYQWPAGTSADLFGGPADWISPGEEGGYQVDPPAADGRKVILNDTDHSAFWTALQAMGHAGQRAWVWKNLTRGNNMMFMDPYLNPAPWYVTLRNAPFAGKPDPYWEILRINMGYARRYADRMNLAAMTPQPALASSGFCLASTDPQSGEFLVYVPQGSWVTVDLTGLAGSFAVEWFYPPTGEKTIGDPVAGGDRRAFNSPYGKTEVVLYLKKSGG